MTAPATIGTTGPSGSAPGIGTWTKPANVPYIQGIRSFNERLWINEKGAQFDGPLFDLSEGPQPKGCGPFLMADLRVHARS